MFSTLYLEWYLDSRWQRIGWDGFTSGRANDLRVHAEKLSRQNPKHSYRLVKESHLKDGAMQVERSFGPKIQDVATKTSPVVEPLNPNTRRPLMSKNLVSVLGAAAFIFGGLVARAQVINGIETLQDKYSKPKPSDNSAE